MVGTGAVCGAAVVQGDVTGAQRNGDPRCPPKFGPVVKQVGVVLLAHQVGEVDTGDVDAFRAASPV